MSSPDFEKYIERLEYIQSRNYDIEADHGAADDTLCELIEEMGGHEVVVAYKKIEKWYA